MNRLADMQLICSDVIWLLVFVEPLYLNVVRLILWKRAIYFQYDAWSKIYLPKTLDVQTLVVVVVIVIVFFAGPANFALLPFYVDEHFIR